MSCQQGLRQGEILFIPIQLENGEIKEKVLKSLTRRADNVIREGEVTGHKHEVVGNAIMFEGSRLANGTLLYAWEQANNDKELTIPKGDMFLDANNNVVIKHPEHADLKLDKGQYIIRIQREYDEAERFRRVAD